MAIVLVVALNGGRHISVEAAVELRDQFTRRAAPEFLCPYCNERVRPHRASRAARAHFEHLVKAECVAHAVYVKSQDRWSWD